MSLFTIAGFGFGAMSEAQIDTAIARLQEVKGILSGTTTTKIKRGPNKAKVATTPITTGKSTMSSEGRARIAAAQRVRWAKEKAKKTA